MGILNFKKEITNKSYLTISLLGNSFKLNVKYINNTSVELIKKDYEIDLLLPKKYKSLDNIDIINSAVQKLYTKIANKELEYSLELARHILKFAPKDYKLERLKDSFYKCYKTSNLLIVNPDIMQYSREIINTTLLQAFCKLKYKANSASYKKALNVALDSYENYKKQSKSQISIIKVS